jgi:hypothetical protein
MLEDALAAQNLKLQLSHHAGSNVHQSLLSISGEPYRYLTYDPIQTSNPYRHPHSSTISPRKNTFVTSVKNLGNGTTCI